MRIKFVIIIYFMSSSKCMMQVKYDMKIFIGNSETKYKVISSVKSYFTVIMFENLKRNTFIHSIVYYYMNLNLLI